MFPGPWSKSHWVPWNEWVKGQTLLYQLLEEPLKSTWEACKSSYKHHSRMSWLTEVGESELGSKYGWIHRAPLWARELNRQVNVERSFNDKSRTLGTKIRHNRGEWHLMEEWSILTHLCDHGSLINWSPKIQFSLLFDGRCVVVRSELV